MTTPYANLPPHYFWKTQIADQASDDIDFDPARKWTFDLSSERFAAAGSCFAQHFARYIRASGGHFVDTEPRHPLVPGNEGGGYGVFSARYGNIYTCRQLRQLLEQAIGGHPSVMDFFQRDDGRWIDLLRMRAVPDGFSSEEACRAERMYHLERVSAIFDQATVFVFTLGLTECWIDALRGTCYPVCPGIVKGAYDPSRHKFENLSFEECVKDLSAAIELIQKRNPAIKILLTVSPVMLVATYEHRGALQSSFVSKAILRAAADRCVQRYSCVDYFPAFEIVSGPQSRGSFFSADGRDVTAEGVARVMSVLSRSRLGLSSSQGKAGYLERAPVSIETGPDPFQAECEEIMLGRQPR